METAALSNSWYDMYGCPNCGLHFSHPMSAPSGEWYAYTYGHLNMHAGQRWEFQHVAATVNGNNHIGEIGCGTGVFLDKCVARGADVFGVDFSESSVSRCHEKGLNVTTFNVEADTVRPHEARDVIASFHVLEHLPDPDKLFELAKSWAASDAVLWIAVPSDRRIDRHFRRKDLFDEPPHHLTKWTPAALRHIGHRHGWYFRRIVYESMPLRQRCWTVCRATGLYRSLARRLDLDRDAGGRERLLRFTLYPLVLTWHWRCLLRLTGASMLTEFRRI